MKKRSHNRYSQPFSILREGIAIGGASFAAAILIGTFYIPLAYPLIAFGLWAIYFFRDPERIPPDTKNIAVSPADGLIVSIKKKKPESKDHNEPMWCISIFMNALDVHVNRAPMASKILDRRHIQGKFLNATLDKSSTENERCIYTCQEQGGNVFFVVQIAGFVARRIVPFCNIGAQLNIGERLGLIRFGSRVDLYLSRKFSILVKEGQRTIAGETVLAQKK